jgi:transcriptional regulator with XRE-family HTH domain
MTELEVPFAERLERWLKVLGMKQSTFARAIDVKPPTVHGWLSGQEAPRIDRLPAIAAALDISLGEFFGPLPKLGATRRVPVTEEEERPHPGTGDVTREIDLNAVLAKSETCPTCGRHGEAA